MQMCKQNVQETKCASRTSSVASVATDLCDSDSDSDSACETIPLHRPSLVAGNEWKGVPKNLPSLAMSKVTPGDGVLGSASGLVQLRTENSRLREALEQAQQNAESQAMVAADLKRVDFEHLLELVKELGYGLGSFAAVDEEAFLEGNQVADETYGAIRISTPRDEMCSDASEGEELAQLREELDDSREENNDLRVALSASDAQVAKAEADAKEAKVKAEADAKEAKVKAEADAKDAKAKAEADAKEAKVQAEADVKEAEAKAKADADAKVAAMHVSVEMGHRSSSLREELLESKNDEIAKLKAALRAKEAEVVELHACMLN